MAICGSKFSKFEAILPDVSGKVFVITGTTSGTGFIAAKTVAEHNGEVLLLNRPSSRSVASLEKLSAAVPNGKFVPIDCDLQDFSSVRKAAGEIKDKYTEIYCLSNNAGIMASPDDMTVDGYDKQMQTNHLSHFLLTKELFPLLQASSKGKCADARIVQHSSMARNVTENGLEDKYLEKQEKNGMLGGDEDLAFMKGPRWSRYPQTKLANSVFTQALHDRLTKSQNKDCENVLSLCAHPGASATNLANHLADGQNAVAKAMMGVIQKLVTQSPEDGSMGLIKAMMTPKDKIEGGTLYGPKGMTGNAIAMPSASHETDPKSMAMLWKKSEDATGGSFVF